VIVATSQSAKNVKCRMGVSRRGECEAAEAKYQMNDRRSGLEVGSTQIPRPSSQQIEKTTHPEGRRSHKAGLHPWGGGDILRREILNIS